MLACCACRDSVILVRMPSPQTSLLSISLGACIQHHAMVAAAWAPVLQMALHII